MNDSAWDRSVRLAEYIIEHHSTVRATAKAFGISQNTASVRLSRMRGQLKDYLNKEGYYA